MALQAPLFSPPRGRWPIQVADKRYYSSSFGVAAKDNLPRLRKRAVSLPDVRAGIGHTCYYFGYLRPFPCSAYHAKQL